MSHCCPLCLAPILPAPSAFCYSQPSQPSLPSPAGRPPAPSHPSPSLPTSAGAGVKLHTTVYVPKLGPDGMPPPPMPMLMQRSPYSAAPYGEPLLGSG